MIYTVAVTGGRGFFDSRVIRGAILSVKPSPTLLIHGGATGADLVAARVAAAMEIPTRVFPANWSAHGRAAGPLRNQEMVDSRPDILLAFPGGRGTEDMVRRAEKAGIPVRRFE